jgi:putative DNA primase/helicase
MGDKITILKHPTNLLAKTWQADGTVKAYDNAKYFVWKEAQVENIGALSALLTSLEHDARSCVVRGVYVGHDKAAELDPEYKRGNVRRIADLFDDAPHHWVLVEIDNFEPLCSDPVVQPVLAIEEFLAVSLPDCFQGVAYHWQLSNSAGHVKNVGKLKAHVWFWLATPYTSEQLKAWATAFGLDLDKSVFNVVQIHYTAAPVFEAGVADPIPVRSGFVDGLISDDVALEIDAGILASGAAAARSSRHQRLLEVADNDPIAQRLADRELIKSVGKKGELFIECPLSENHTQESGATATVYYPAHTGGYANGAFVCQHAHCRDVPQSVFLSKIGIDPVDDDFEAIGEGQERGEAEQGAKKIRIPEAQHLTTDQANAVRIVKRYGQRLMVSADRWFAWVGTHWAQDDAAVYRFALNLSKVVHAEADQWRAKKADTSEEREKNDKIADALISWARKSEMRGTIEAALGLAKRMLAVKAEDLDADPWALNCANGTVDLRTGKIRPHNPDDYLTRFIGLPYLPQVKAPLFETVIARVACEEGKAVRPLSGFLQRWFGYCATGSVREQKFAVHYGQGRNGKSTVLDIVADVLGGYAATAAPGLLMSNSRDRHPTEIADLAGRRMVTAHETGEGGVLREDFVKQATGGDKIKARYMRGDFFEFLPTHKLQLLTNHKPVIKGQDEGIWRRVMLVPFKARFGTPEEVASGRATCLRDTRIVEHLAAEKEGVLAWIVAGAVDWFRDGLNPPDVVLAASKDYQTEQDRVFQFVNEECELGTEFEEKISTPFGGGLYPAYSNWCKAGGIHPLAKNRFLSELERCVPFFARFDKYEANEGAKRRKFAAIRGLRLVDSEL